MNARAFRTAFLIIFSPFVSNVFGLDPVRAQDANGAPPPVQRRDQNIELAMKIRKPFTFVAVGDLLQTLPFSKTDNPASQYLFDIIRKADAAVGNNETTIIDPDTFRGPNTTMQAPPSVADSWKNMGIDIVTRANNHTFDAGEEGLWQDLHELDRVGIQHVGVGINLTEARLAGFYETPKGQVGAVGVYTQNDLGRVDPSIPPVQVTADQLSQLRAIRDSIVARRGEVENPIPVPGPDPDVMVSVFGVMFSSRAAVSPRREGVGGAAARRGVIKSQANVLNLTTYNGVTEAQFGQLKAIAGDQGKMVGDALSAWGKMFRVTPGPGEYHYEMNPQEERDILREVRSGKQMSGFMSVMVHWHQNRYAFQHYSFDHYPADYEIKFAHECIDQGADVFAGHGVHTIKGIEIYKGKPIFYGLSNFFLTLMNFRSWRDSGDHKPTSLVGPILGDGEEDELRWSWMEQPDNDEALLSQSHYENGKLVEVRIYPVDLGETAKGMAGLARPGSELGVPRKPSPAKSKDILTRLQKYSAPFGTKIDIKDGIGVIHVSAN